MNRIFVILFILPIIALSQEEKFKKYDHPKYSIEYPQNWILDESGKEGPLFVVYPRVVDEKVFVENINLTVQNLVENKFSIEQIKSITEKQMSNMLSNSRIIESKIVDENKLIYHKIIAVGETSGMKFKTKIQTYIINNYLYTLTLVSLDEDYESIKVISNKIMDSFLLK